MNRQGVSKSEAIRQVMDMGYGSAGAISILGIDHAMFVVRDHGGKFYFYDQNCNPYFWLSIFKAPLLRARLRSEYAQNLSFRDDTNEWVIRQPRSCYTFAIKQCDGYVRSSRGKFPRDGLKPRYIP